MPIALGAILVGIAALRRQSCDFAVTNRRVVTKVGILNTRSIELLLTTGQIEAIAVNQGVPGRLFD